MRIKTRPLRPPMIAAIAATRAMLCAGAGLRLSGRISRKWRRALGWTLLGAGLASTVPLAATVLRRG
jgi:hypothetical protein